MLIDLNHELFTVNPDIKFSRQYNVPLGTLWSPDSTNKNTVWFRYKTAEYEMNLLQEWILLKYKVHIPRRSLFRYFNRVEVYLKMHPIILRGAKQMNPDGLDGFKPFVLEELAQKEN